MMKVEYIKMMKVEYIGDCHHLFCDDIRDDSCLKRYFDVTHPKTGGVVRYGICSDYIRLKLFEKRKMVEFEPPMLNNAYRVYKIVEDLLIEAIDMKNISSNPSKIAFIKDDSYFLQIPVNICVCSKIGMYSYIPMGDAMHYYTEGNLGIKKNIIQAVEMFVSEKKGYKRYKPLTSKLEKLLKRGSAGYVNPALFMSELMVLIIKIKTNPNQLILT